MKIAITAASGNLASHIIEELKKTIPKKNIRAIARTVNNVRHKDVEIFKGDYNDKTHFTESLKGIDTLLLISSMAPPDVRKIQHANVIGEAIGNGVRKIVYTSITGPEEGTAFSPVVNSNRYTENLIQNTGVQWVIGRNGLYIDPDLDYLQTYVNEGEIRNCAGDGKCPYTSRNELARAYVKLLTEEKHNGSVYNLVGEPVTQQQLTDAVNEIYNLNLSYREISEELFTRERKEVLGDLLGTIVGGIYEAIKKGDFNVPSDFKKATGRSHLTLSEMIRAYKAEEK